MAKSLLIQHPCKEIAPPHRIGPYSGVEKTRRGSIYHLSNVMFITTANTLNIPPPLMNPIEIIRIAGYTEDEKVEIARKHLISIF
jgi:hypothetical protein